jgi:hypothetical protein
MKRPLGAELGPFRAELAHAPLHGDRHAHAGPCILLHALGFRVAEEGYHGVADILVDRGAIVQSDPRHLSQIAVEHRGELLGFEVLGGRGEIGDVGEEDGELLAVRRDLDALGAGEDRLIDLRREIFRELVGERLELLVLLRDDLVGAALLLAHGVELLLVAVAQAHEPAGGAEQLLIILEQVRKSLPVLAVGELAVGDQFLCRRDHAPFGRE